VRELYVYYRVPAEKCGPAREAVTRLQRELQSAWPGLQARLLCRVDEATGQQTWMEAYSTDPLQRPAGVDSVLEAAIDLAGRELQAPVCTATPSANVPPEGPASCIFCCGAGCCASFRWAACSLMPQACPGPGPKATPN
jgi:hypothetical protein